MKSKRKILFIIVGGVVALLIIGGVSVMYVFTGIIADAFLCPNRQPLVKNPGDYGLKYEDVSIKTEDGVVLAGWFMKGTNDDVIILGHPGTFIKYGYSLDHEGIMKSGYDRDVEFIPVAKHLVNAGYTVLMYDQRNHGESGSTPNGTPHDIVHDVYLDVEATAQFASNHPDMAGKDIGLLAFCQNSMNAMVAMSKEPDALREAGVKCTVIIQPHALDLFFKNFGIPDFVINRAKRIYLEKGVTAMEDWNPVPFAKKVFVPTLFVQNVNDPWSDMEHIRAIYGKIPTEKSAIWIDEEETHRFLTYNWFNDHPEPLLDFLGKYM
jgi:pimeloyl-ACP methyl ester carboxylesterase